MNADFEKKPVKTIRNSAYISLIVVSVLYIFVNIAYFAAGTSQICLFAEY
jgi:hypothetical protein